MKVETFNKAMGVANHITAVDREIEKFDKQIGEDLEFMGRANVRLCFDSTSLGGDFNTSKTTSEKQLPEDVRESIDEIVDNAAHRIHDLLRRKKQKLEKEFEKISE